MFWKAFFLHKLKYINTFNENETCFKKEETCIIRQWCLLNMNVLCYAGYNILHLFWLWCTSLCNKRKSKWVINMLNCNIFCNALEITSHNVANKPLSFLHINKCISMKINNDPVWETSNEVGEPNNSMCASVAQL